MGFFKIRPLGWRRYPKDPAVLKKLRDSELLRVVFLVRPPDKLRYERFFERTDVCNSQENGVRTRCAAIVNHYVTVNLLRRVIDYGAVFLVRRGALGSCLSGLPNAEIAAF